MKPVDRTVPSQTDAIAFEFDLPHAPTKVWRALTDAGLLSEWLLPVKEIPLVPGATFTFTTQPNPDWDGVVHCRILEVDPPNRLRYAWVVGDDLNTVVTFTLTPTAAGTHLLLVQSGFLPHQKQNFGGARYGWRMMGTRLVDQLGRSE
jgi:uncharacterized protein YndB with AHSA1/START domain